MAALAKDAGGNKLTRSEARFSKFPRTVRNFPERKQKTKERFRQVRSQVHSLKEISLGIGREASESNAILNGLTNVRPFVFAVGFPVGGPSSQMERVKNKE